MSSRGRGGSSGDFSNFGSSSSNSRELVDAQWIWGHRFTSLWTPWQFTSQLALNIVWGVFSVILLVCAWKIARRKKKKGEPVLKKEVGWVGGLGFAFLCLLASFALQATRFGLISSKASVMKTWRLEPCFSTFLFNISLAITLGRFCCLLKTARLTSNEAAIKPPKSKLYTRVLTLILVLIFTLLITAYFILDIILAMRAITSFNSFNGWWRLSDRDFAMLLSDENILKPKLGATGLRLNFGYITGQWVPERGEDWGGLRTRQIQVQTGYEVVGLVSTVLFAPLMVSGLLRTRMGGKFHTSPYFPAVFISLPLLFIHFLYKTIIVLHFISHNWNLVKVSTNWGLWTVMHEESFLSFDVSDPYVFLPGYRRTVNGFDKVDGILGPLPVLLAGLGLLVVGRSVKRSLLKRQVDRQGQRKVEEVREEKVYDGNAYAPPPNVYVPPSAHAQ